MAIKSNMTAIDGGKADTETKPKTTRKPRKTTKPGADTKSSEPKDEVKSPGQPEPAPQQQRLNTGYVYPIDQYYDEAIEIQERLRSLVYHKDPMHITSEAFKIIGALIKCKGFLMEVVKDQYSRDDPFLSRIDKLDVPLNSCLKTMDTIRTNTLSQSIYDSKRDSVAKQLCSCIVKLQGCCNFITSLNVL